MDRRGYQQYKQQSVNSMTPGELLLLLYDELVKRGTIASIALDKADYPAFEAAIDRCVDIVNYLDETLDRQYPMSWSSCAPCWLRCGMPSTPRRKTAPVREDRAHYERERAHGPGCAGAEEVQLPQ